MNNYHKNDRLLFILLDFRKDQINPKTIEGEVGDDVSFMCSSDEDVKWNFIKKDNLPDNIETYFVRDMYYFKIKNIQVHNSGIYVCKGKIKNEYFYAKGNLLVNIREFNLPNNSKFKIVIPINAVLLYTI